MALWVCTDCTSRYSVGAPKCPQCGSTEYAEEGAEDMPKITVHGGPSIAGASVTGGAWSDTDAPDTWPSEEGGEESSDGSSSETSPETPSSDTEPSSTPTPKRARTTGSRSKKDQTESSSVPSTDGGQAAGTSAADKQGS